jgi:hypothetical protein
MRLAVYVLSSDNLWIPTIRSRPSKLARANVYHRLEAPHLDRQGSGQRVSSFLR